MFNPQPKKGIKRKKKIKSIEPDPSYLEYIRSIPCMVPLMCSQKSIAHHESTCSSDPGMAIKCSDYLTIPLCSLHHNEIHTIGAKTFYERYSIDPQRILITLLKNHIIQIKKGDIRVSEYAVEHFVNHLKILEEFVALFNLHEKGYCTSETIISSTFLSLASRAKKLLND